MESNTEKRRCWISVLARADTDELEKYWSQITNQPDFKILRQPQTGLVMMRGRSGGTGKRFNFGEITVTRCSVTLENETQGHGYVMGRNKRHAQLVALFDAILQDEHHEQDQYWRFIQALAAGQKAAKEERMAKVASTKVDFYTMETEDPNE